MVDVDTEKRINADICHWLGMIECIKKSELSEEGKERLIKSYNEKIHMVTGNKLRMVFTDDGEMVFVR